MKMFTTLTAVAGLCILLTYSSCTSGGGGFTTKEDSLRFAKAYFKKYPDENSVTTKLQSADSIVARGFGPISWDQVLDYKKNYDKNPIIYGPDGVALHGFTIDSTGYRLIQRSRQIRGLYLRFGRKVDGVFTIMVLGMDSKGNVIKDSSLLEGDENSDFDNVPKCPMDCPENFE